MGRTMTQAAVMIGAKMGVQLRGGTPVKASGNCLIESVRGNIEERPIFDVKLVDSALELRMKSAVEGERVIGESPYRIEDYNEVEWAHGWNLLKNEGIWDVEYFGDLMIIALAHYIHKNILLINTDPDSPNITVIVGDQFGEDLDSDAPVLLAYSGNHYESLIPDTREDEEKIKTIISKYVTGDNPCSEDLDNDTNEETNTKDNSNNIERESPKFQIDNWEHHNDDNNTKTLHPLEPGADHTVTRSPSWPEEVGCDVTGLDNWRHCRTTGHIWEEDKEATPIPIIRIKPSPTFITIPITRVNI